MDTRRKLIFLAEAARYDASCVSCGTSRRDSADGPGIGSTEGGDIHLETVPDASLNRAAEERLLRVPGLGVRFLGRLLLARRTRGVRRADPDRLRVPVAKVLPFVALPDHPPRGADRAPLRGPMRPSSQREAQADLLA